MMNKYLPCPLCGMPPVDRTGYFSEFPSNFELVECLNVGCKLHGKLTFGGFWNALSRHMDVISPDGTVAAIEGQFVASLLEKQKEIDDLQKKIAMREEMIEKTRPLFPRSDLWNAIFDDYDKRKKNGE